MPGWPGCRSRISESWAELVGAGDCGFVRTGFLQLMPPALAAKVRANVAMQQAIGVDTRVVEPAEVARLVPGACTDDIGVGGLRARVRLRRPVGDRGRVPGGGPRGLGARFVQGCRVERGRRRRRRGRRRRDRPRPVRRAGRRRRRRRLGGRARPDRRGRGPGRDLAPRHRLLRPARRPRAGLPDRHRRDQRGLLPARGPRLDAGRAGGRQRGRRLARPAASAPRPATSRTWSGASARASRGWPTARSAPPTAARTGSRPPTSARSSVGPGRTASTSPAGSRGRASRRRRPSARCLAELILDGRATTVDISGYSLERFAAGRLLVGEHPYGKLWR